MSKFVLAIGAVAIAFLAANGIIQVNLPGSSSPSSLKKSSRSSSSSSWGRNKDGEFSWCPTHGPDFEPWDEANTSKECRVGFSGVFYNYAFATQMGCVEGSRGIHGLWPNYFNRSQTGGYEWPQFCTNERFDVNKIRTVPGLFERMSRYWKSCPPKDKRAGKSQFQLDVAFWTHEWERHGTCSGYSQAEYFTTVINFFLKELSTLDKTCDKQKNSCMTHYLKDDVYQAVVHDRLVPPYVKGESDPRDNCGPNDQYCWPLETTDANYPTELAGGVWRSYGAENHASGALEFIQKFDEEAKTQFNRADGPKPKPYGPTTCYPTYTYGPEDPFPNVALANCSNSPPTNMYQYCKYRPVIAGFETVDVAYWACNHTGWPAPSTFQEAMHGFPTGNFFMIRCKPEAGVECNFEVDFPNFPKHRGLPNFQVEKGIPTQAPQLPPTGPATPKRLMGNWRGFMIQQDYHPGVVGFNFNSNATAVLNWNNKDYELPSTNYIVYTAPINVTNQFNPQVFLKNVSSNGTLSCLTQFNNDDILTYMVLTCGPENRPAPANMKAGLTFPNIQFVLSRCNAGDSAFCDWSCSDDNDQCGTVPTHRRIGTRPDQCQQGESCWPTEAEIEALRAKLNPGQKRNFHWDGYPQGQPSAVPFYSNDAQVLYGLGKEATQVDALYVNKQLGTPCFTGNNYQGFNQASDFCKAATRNQPYNNYTPAFVVFAQDEDQVVTSLQFALDHKLCVSVASTGHEYLNRHTCPTGGMMIRTAAMKHKEFLPTWEKNPSLTATGAFRFGPGLTFSEGHAYAQEANRVISSGWCNTVGLIGWSVGGGHGPLAPSLGLGVDNTLEFSIVQVSNESGKPVVVRRLVNEKENPDLFWAMKGGGGSTWGIVTSVTIRAHPIPKGGFTQLNVTSRGTFCSTGYAPYGLSHNLEFSEKLWEKYGQWQLGLNEKFSIQTSIWPNGTLTGDSRPTDQECIPWKIVMTYIYNGPATDKAQVDARNAILAIMDPQTTGAGDDQTLKEFPGFFGEVDQYPGDQFLLRPMPMAPTNAQNTASQSSALISREVMGSGAWAKMTNELLSWCPLKGECGFHFLYLSFTGNKGSPQPTNTALSPGMRSYMMAHNARGLSQQQLEETLYGLSDYSYFSESPFYMPGWGNRYWGPNFDKLRAVKAQYDPLSVFWCHHCIGDDPNAAD